MSSDHLEESFKFVQDNPSLFTDRRSCFEYGYKAAMEVKENELETNARLISAAPDILEALIELTQLTESLLFNTMGEPKPGSIGHKCRAAIAKATGEPL